MGKATVDLPDPTQQPALEKVNSADDLLSEMVGDDIDRMLAGADVVRPPRVAAAPPGATEPAKEHPSEPEPIAPEPALAEDAPRIATPEDVQPELDQQLSSLMSKLGDQPNAAVAEALPAPEPAEAQALPQDADGSPEAEITQGEPEDRATAWYVRMLVLANAPLASCPDSWRQTAGKVAIITLIDAAAVLAYVLLFSRG